jgi:hypothetical protein
MHAIFWGTVPPILFPKTLKTKRNARIFVGTVPAMLTPKMFKKQRGMLALFWYCASGFHTKNVSKTRRNARLFLVLSPPKLSFFGRFWCHFPSRGHPWSLPGSLG